MQKHKLEILYEDNHLLCAVKPAGIATQVSKENPHSFEDELKAYLKTTYNKPGNVFLHAVHRLDKPTSGIVIFAKTSKALSRLNEEMLKRSFLKTYIAHVEGNVFPLKATLEHYLIHADHKAIVAKEGQLGAKLCKLSYEVTKKEKDTSVIQIELETGRYHQIRAQFAAIGHPIVGDMLYGAKTAKKKGPIALHHASCIFFHPVTKKEIILRSLPS